MNPSDPLTTLFSHNLWANLGLLEACAKLSAEQLNATLTGTYGSIHDTLQYAERSYFSLISTGARHASQSRIFPWLVGTPPRNSAGQVTGWLRVFSAPKQNPRPPTRH